MIEREIHNYENLSKKYEVQNIDYMKQYCLLYLHRFKEMYPLLQKCAEQRWGHNYAIKKVADLDENTTNQNESIILIGTLYKHQAHKPSVLRELSEENQLAPQPTREHYADGEDQLLLEDEVQRVRLYGKIDTKYMATGVMCAVLGSVEQSGRFAVEDALFYESGPQDKLQPLNKSRGLLVFISGLDKLNPQSEDYVASLNLFQHWLCGNISKQEPKQLIRLIVAGNSVQQGAIKRAPNYQTARSRGEEYNDVAEAVATLDKWFAAWAHSIPLDVMPGAYDPTNFMLPQQAFHPLMFPEAAKQRYFQSVTNPYECKIDNVLIVGTSGQNVRDLLRSTFIEHSLEALRSTLKWSHIAPTAPDTLACHPFKDADPLIMTTCPHIYFAGNCREFSTEIHEGSAGQRTRLVCVPAFGLTQSVAVVDLDTLDCRQVTFGNKIN